MSQKHGLSVMVLLVCFCVFKKILMDLTPDEDEAAREARMDDELMKIIVVEMIRDNDNCRDYFPWSRKGDGVYGPTEVHCNHACNLIADLYVMNGRGDNETRITHGGRCKNSWTIFKRCMCRLKDPTMPNFEWRTLHFIVDKYLGTSIMKKYLNHSSTNMPTVTKIDPAYTAGRAYRDSTDRYKDYWA